MHLADLRVSSFENEVVLNCLAFRVAGERLVLNNDLDCMVAKGHGESRAVVGWLNVFLATITACTGQFLVEQPLGLFRTC